MIIAVTVSVCGSRALPIAAAAHKDSIKQVGCLVHCDNQGTQPQETAVRITRDSMKHIAFIAWCLVQGQGSI